ncbi:beta/alpha barrel domain-containing protein [Hymenobacter psychrophilus]|uniref:2-dehydro-3-deoxyphosphogluconate aldolase / (4S)-4-hydroxy-2-oxoglutarate aldolase n=1 Tax=Hymenobacter psychrophilus TaxID=651662 RepID=A0A1H3LA88_9BACT|nr:bifunctional 4-hydroxy-2-oxoglutarate aldolase/2-dehydro-3-deoxy-phosphogluconate aldolase [Hymenobacter psychrophilus]SDY61196.1 2-dehydro-3-deoxyphosphogluconate aldolase / (4S)-4-hydroxy-2-oxoglutarate aldolase [Hymenobacter psychrophilus]
MSDLITRTKPTPADVVSTLLAVPLVPVYYHPEAELVQRLLQACYAGGLRAFEYTNRGAGALAVFRELRAYTRQHLPDMLLGIGTVFTAEEAEQFIEAGADFVVQPCATAEVAEVCRQHRVAWLPGAMTVREVYEATQLGAALVKVFPGNVVGPGFVRALRGPLPQVRVMVTGGVEPTEASLREWFAAGAAAVGLGSQLFTTPNDPAALSQQLTDLLAFVKTLRT